MQKIRFTPSQLDHACRTHARHVSRREAMTIKKQHERSYGAKRLSIWRCPLCDGFHMGHKPLR